MASLRSLTGKPGAKVDDPITITISPETRYGHFVNKLVTGAPDSKPSLDTSDPVTQSDGSIEVTLTGSIPAHRKHSFDREIQAGAYAVPSPTRFATFALRRCLADTVIQIKLGKSSPAFAAFKKFDTFDYVVAEHTSPSTIALKVSHQSSYHMGQYFLGNVCGKGVEGCAECRMQAGKRISAECEPRSERHLTR